MSKYDYDISKHIVTMNYPFASLMMAALRQADSKNARVLAKAFPEITDELIKRYNAPGGGEEEL